MKKRTILLVCSVLVVSLFSGCNTKEPAHVKDEPIWQTTVITEASQPANEVAKQSFRWLDTPAHNAFRRTLRTIHDTLILPNADYREISLWEPGTIENETFAVLDVDGDGEDELLVGISNTYNAGMCKVVYGYDQEQDDVRQEAQTWFSAQFYPNMIRVDVSHNHGHAGDVMWPYTVMEYDKETDCYRDAYYVDAWSRELAEYDSLLERSYPQEIDTENDGFVYLVTENDDTTILNRRHFQSWEAAIFAGKEPIQISWMKMTSDNI